MMSDFIGAQQITIKCSVRPVSDTWDCCDHTTHKTTVLCGSDHPSVTESKRDPCKWEKRSKLASKAATEEGRVENESRNREVFSAEGAG